MYLNTTTFFMLYDILMALLLSFSLPKLLIPKKLHNHPHLIITLIEFVAFTILFFLSKIMFMLIPFGLISILFLSCFFLYQDSIARKSFVVFAIYFVMISCEIICTTIFRVLNYIFPVLNLSTTFIAESEDQTTYFFYLLIIGLLFLIVYYFIVPILKTFIDIIYIKITLQLAFPFVLILIFANVFWVFDLTKQVYMISIFIFLLLYLCCCILLLRGLRNFRKYNSLQSKQKLRKEQLLLQISHSKVLEHQYADIYKWNHDINNHLLALDYLIKQLDYEGAETYIEKILTHEEDSK